MSPKQRSNGKKKGANIMSGDFFVPVLEYAPQRSGIKVAAALHIKTYKWTSTSNQKLACFEYNGQRRTIPHKFLLVKPDTPPGEAPPDAERCLRAAVAVLQMKRTEVVRAIDDEDMLRGERQQAGRAVIWKTEACTAEQYTSDEPRTPQAIPDDRGQEHASDSKRFRDRRNPFTPEKPVAVRSEHQIVHSPAISLPQEDAALYKPI